MARGFQDCQLLVPKRIERAESTAYQAPLSRYSERSFRSRRFDARAAKGMTD